MKNFSFSRSKHILSHTGKNATDKIDKLHSLELRFLLILNQNIDFAIPAPLSATLMALLSHFVRNKRIMRLYLSLLHQTGSRSPGLFLWLPCRHTGLPHLP